MLQHSKSSHLASSCQYHRHLGNKSFKSVSSLHTDSPQRATLKTMPLKDGAMSATYSPWLHTAKLPVLPSCSSVVVAWSAFWKCVTLNGLFVLMVHLNHDIYNIILCMLRLPSDSRKMNATVVLNIFSIV